MGITPDFAVPSLEALVARGDTVAGVFTQPDKPKGRGKKLTPPPVKVAAQAHGIPVYQPRRIRKDGVEDLRALAPDLCVTAAFGQILSQALLDVPKMGTVNVHASLLPAYRGAAPINWCILNGETKTGVTTMLTDAGVGTVIHSSHAAYEHDRHPVPVMAPHALGAFAARLSENN